MADPVPSAGNWYDNIVTALKNSLEAVFVKKSDIVDNLSTNDATKVLSAKQGKELNDKIGSITDFFNGTGD